MELIGGYSKLGDTDGSLDFAIGRFLIVDFGQGT